MVFKYSGYDKFGKSVTSQIEAETIIIAKSILKKREIIFSHIQEVPISKPFFTYSSKSSIKALHLANISKDIATFLNAGISLVNSIKMLKNQYEYNKKMSLFFESISGSLNEGKTFYQALEIQSIYQLPLFYMQSIKVSENGGILYTVLLELSSFLKDQDKISKQINSALAYPLFIFSVSILMIGFLMSVVVPKIVGVFESQSQELPTITLFVIEMSEFISAYWTLVLTILVIFIIITLWLYSNVLSFKYYSDKYILKIPFINQMIEANQLSQFSYITSLLIKSGVTLTQAIKLSSEILSNSAIKKAFLNSSTKVIEGERLSVVLQKQDIKLDRVFIQSLSLGEETSTVGTILESMAIMYKEKNSDKISIMLSLLEPIMMLFVGGFVGFIVVSMLLPIFSMNIG